MNVTQAIIDKCLKGDRWAQKRLYNLSIGHLKIVVRRYNRGDRDSDKDILQESYLKIFRSLIKYQSSKGRLLSWMTQIAINTSLNYNSRKHFQYLNIDNCHDLKNIDKTILDTLNDADLIRFLKTMPEENYIVLNLFCVEGYSHREISKMLSISEESSRKRLSRSRAWLKKNVKTESDNLGLQLKNQDKAV